MDVHVLRDFWGDGAIGEALLAAVVDTAAAAAGAEKVEFNTFASNRKFVAMCQKFGFHEEATKRGAVKTNAGLYDDEVCMARFLLERKIKGTGFTCKYFLRLVFSGCV